MQAIVKGWELSDFAVCFVMHILCQHGVLWILRKNKDIVTIKPDKWNSIVILDKKILQTLFMKQFQTNLNSKSSMKTQPKTWNLKSNIFYVSSNKKHFFNENEYDKLYPSGSDPAHIYGTPRIYKFSSSDSFPKLHPIVLSMGTFNHNLAGFLCDFPSPNYWLLLQRYFFFCFSFSIIILILTSLKPCKKLFATSDSFSF